MTESRSETIEERALRVWNGLSPEQQAMYNKAAWLLSYHDDIDPVKMRDLLAGQVGEKMNTVADILSKLTPTVVKLGESCTVASYSMADLKTAIFGDDPLETAIAEKRCSKSIGCGTSLVKDDGSPEYVFDTREEAETYEMEWRRTGLCPKCLDKAFDALDGVEPEEIPEDEPVF